MQVVADTSALIALATCKALSLLHDLFDQILVPPAVYEEATVQGKFDAQALQSFLHDKIEHVDLTELVIAASGLGQGELEAMALYKKLHADRLLVDDARARRVARFNGIEVVGSLGVLLLGKRRGLLSAVRPMVDILRASEIRMSEPLLSKVLEMAGEQV